jgi:hypothetical protein
LNQSQNTDKYNLIRSLTEGQNPLSEWIREDDPSYPNEIYTRYDLNGIAVATIFCENQSYDGNVTTIYHLKFATRRIQDYSTGYPLAVVKADADTLLQRCNYLLPDVGLTKYDDLLCLLSSIHDGFFILSEWIQVDGGSSYYRQSASGVRVVIVSPLYDRWTWSVEYTDKHSRKSFYVSEDTLQEALGKADEALRYLVIYKGTRSKNQLKGSKTCLIQPYFISCTPYQKIGIFYPDGRSPRNPPIPDRIPDIIYRVR